ncbi:MAG TPA: FMN-binding protein [Deltaproteobacteria bacterium]|nr:FMN-binding protein [Deltaproteobacteria bacterium]
MARRCSALVRSGPAALAAGLVLCLAAAAAAKVFSTRDEALARVFAGADRVERVSAFLSREEMAAASKLAAVAVDSGLFTYYRAVKDGAVQGYAVFASHVVRTRQAVTLVVVEPDLRVRSVEVLAFFEPREYLPSKRWFALFRGLVLGEDLRPGRDVRAVTGATLSVATITAEVRKTLAVLEVLLGEKKGD